MWLKPLNVRCNEFVMKKLALYVRQWREIKKGRKVIERETPRKRKPLIKVSLANVWRYSLERWWPLKREASCGMYGRLLGGFQLLDLPPVLGAKYWSNSLCTVPLPYPLHLRDFRVLGWFPRWIFQEALKFCAKRVMYSVEPCNIHFRANCHIERIPSANIPCIGGHHFPNFAGEFPSPTVALQHCSIATCKRYNVSHDVIYLVIREELCVTVLQYLQHDDNLRARERSRTLENTHSPHSTRVRIAMVIFAIIATHAYMHSVNHTNK